MKLNLLAALAAVGLVVIGCVGTVSDRHVAGWPLNKDRVVGQYERSPAVVAATAKKVISDNGVLLNESVLHSGGTNAVPTLENTIQTLEGNVQERRVFVRIEALDAKTTQVTVQARGGSGDIALAHELEKQIAVRLVVTP